MMASLYRNLAELHLEEAEDIEALVQMAIDQSQVR
jgi:hypothetical protein